MMSFSFNIWVSAFVVPDLRECLPIGLINWIWGRLLLYIMCYRLLQTRQWNLHQATDLYTCATSHYKQGGLLQVYNCYRGYITLLIWPLFSWCSLDAKILNKYITLSYSLIHSVRTPFSASKPSINHQASTFPVEAWKSFLSMVLSITDYVLSNVQSAQVNSGLRQQDLSFGSAIVW
jgi:hypothetical protein